MIERGRGGSWWLPLVWVPAVLFGCSGSDSHPGQHAQQGSTATAQKLLSPSSIPPPDDLTRPPRDAERTPSGLASKRLRPGQGGERPTGEDTVVVQYTGWTEDGRVFDSSVMRKQPATLVLRNSIAGWTEGVALMVPGEKRRLWIPGDLAYRGKPGRPQGTLVFDVEPLAVERASRPQQDAASRDAGE